MVPAEFLRLQGLNSPPSWDLGNSNLPNDASHGISRQGAKLAKPSDFFASFAPLREADLLNLFLPSPLGRGKVRVGQRPDFMHNHAVCTTLP